MPGLRSKPFKAALLISIFLVVLWYLRSHLGFAPFDRKNDQRHPLALVNEVRTFPQDCFKSQAGQDKWLFESVFQHSPPESFFIEFGARNGMDDSNSYFLEKSLGWWGLLAEASEVEQQNIANVRTNATIINGAICKDNNPLTFVKLDIGWGGAKETYDPKRLEEVKDKMKEVKVPCFRLDELMDHFGVHAVDYLSADTEGSELDALSKFPFDVIPVRVVGIEVLIGPGREGRVEKTIEFMKERRYNLFREFKVGNDTLDLFFEPAFSTEDAFSLNRFNKDVFLSARERCRQNGICLSPK